MKRVRARQILDSRGRPTVEADVELADGTQGRASVPSGASTGAAEAHELRDREAGWYGGMGVRRAVDNVNGEIARAIAGLDSLDQRGLDAALRSLDGTPRLERLGANAILAVSLAACRAAAAAQGVPLFVHVARLAANDRPLLPLPMVNILSGGLHARQGMDVQDFLALPASAASMEEAVHVMARVRSAAVDVLQERGLSTLLADEGGLSPGCETPEAALDLMMLAIERAKLRPGADVMIAVDVAATPLRTARGTYRLARAGRELGTDEMVDMFARWVGRYPVVSIEDGLHEEDWAGWEALSRSCRGRLQIVGDDLFATNLARLEHGIARGVANAVLVKLNQNGTLTGTLDVIARARRAGYAPIVSARSGETEDPFIADLAVGTAAGQIKIGSLRTSSTVCKYNQLLRIEEESGAPYAGIAALPVRPC